MIGHGLVIIERRNSVSQNWCNGKGNLLERRKENWHFLNTTPGILYVLVFFCFFFLSYPSFISLFLLPSCVFGTDGEIKAQVQGEVKGRARFTLLSESILHSLY